MKAVILAAGDGERLAPITQTLPKAMLPIAGETIISRMLRQLVQNGIDEVIVVIGYEAAQLRGHVQSFASNHSVNVTFVENRLFQTTNTAYSSLLAAPYVTGEAFLLIDGDIIAEDDVIRHIACSDATRLLYEEKTILGPEEMKVAIAACGTDQCVVTLGKEIEQTECSGEFVGIIHFDMAGSSLFFEALSRLEDDVLCAVYYEHALNHFIERRPLFATSIDHSQWLEVDFVTDYLEAVRNFNGRRHVEQANVTEQILLCPGPVMVSPRVKSALLHEDIGHRETEFIEILTRTRAKLLRAYGVSPSSDYTDVVITGSGTAANEALLSTFGPGKRMLMPVNGEFGLRLVDIATCHGIDVTTLDFGWTQPFDLERLRRLLATEKFDALMMVHHETSTGMLNPVREVGSLCTEFGVDFCLDAVSSIGAEKLWIEQSNVTFCTASANKAIACLPGLSFVCGKRSAFAQLEAAKPHTRYLDLYKHYEFEELRYQTPNTPAVSLFFALEAALDELLEDTLERRMEQYGRHAARIRNKIFQLGLSPVIPESEMSRVLTTIWYPEQMDAEAFHQWIKKHNYVIYRGKGPLYGRAFQVANIGQVLDEHIEGFLSVVEQYVADNTKRVAGGL